MDLCVLDSRAEAEGAVDVAVEICPSVEEETPHEVSRTMFYFFHFPPELRNQLCDFIPANVRFELNQMDMTKWLDTD
jgi:hypothetical protein